MEPQATIEGDQSWYRYHHLFTDLLRARLKQSQPTIIPQLYLRASAWYEQNGLMLEAIQHSFSAKDNERAAELMERYGPARWSQSDTTLMMLTMHLSQEVLIAHPKLGLYRAWILIAGGHLAAAIVLLVLWVPEVNRVPALAASAVLRAALGGLLRFEAH